MSLYLRFLSICYFIGFLLHLGDVFDLRLTFSEMNIVWQSWILFLLVGDFVTSVALWRFAIIGIWGFLLIACTQIIAYTFFSDVFGPQYFLVGFHVVTIVGYFVVGSLKLRIEIAGTNFGQGQLRAVGNSLKMYEASVLRGISFRDAALTIHSTTAYVNEDTRRDYGERRFNLVGLSFQKRALHVTFTKRQAGEITRLISVRRASKKERRELSERFPDAEIS